ncbi:3-isopropylmalate dehydratase large subunit [Thermogymnomonas acidicola]|uniref:3-isopropylmalate dehydratase large subunit n=1 Tax=Thermogymnomonas acidicola TaxID=399579 RepID=A0AA37BS29_9ARCH|nr:3-isopropylmalate dehydratase large subunit [Thermogymnomonas acidicola]
MAMNMVEKILAEHSGLSTVSPGDIVNVSVDRAILLDIAGLHPELVRNPPKRPFDPDRVSIVFDHFVPPATVELAEGTSKIRKLARAWGIRNFYDAGRGGISHALGAELGWFVPGSIIANTDSHSVAAGAFNCLSRGLGTPELMQVLCTGRTWFIVGETVRIDFQGGLRKGVEAKDAFFEIARRVGDISNMNIEFGGDMHSLSMDDRSSISAMTAELGVEFSIFEHDSVLSSYLSGRVGNYRPVAPDAGAPYAQTHTVDLGELEPMVAVPHNVVGNVRPVGDVQGTRIDQAVIGSCANGRLHDLEVAARILKGRKVNRDVRLIVTPATVNIYREALELGYIKAIAEAGAVVTNPTCGSCFGGHMGLLAPGEVAVTSTTRNFRGRMGSRDASIFLASSATVAASALNGYISDPREVMAQ